MDGAQARRAPGSKRKTPPGVKVRRLAVEVVEHVLKSRSALDESLDQAIDAALLDERDGSLARAIATATFRHLGSLRRALAERLPKGMPAKAGSLETILITAAVQILDLDVPDRAAVDVAVQLTRDDNRSAPYGGLANAVLRRVSAEKADILAARDPLADDTPAWLAARWEAAYGSGQARAIAAAHARGAALDLSVKNDPARWAQALDAIVLPTGSLRVTVRGAVPSLPGFAEGAWWVQDAAAALPVLLLAPKPGERVLDLCAAPGGKTAQIAASGAQVIAVDRSARRLERVSQNLARLNLTAEILAADAAELDLPPADAVLLDAPCSATGTLRRHPDVAWTKSEGDIAKLAALQERLLAQAARLVKPGGRLVYCTCSLEPEEGEAQIARFLSRNSGFRRLPVSADEIGGLPGAVTADGDLRTLPSMLPSDLARGGGMDGFFAARLVRYD